MTKLPRAEVPLIIDQDAEAADGGTTDQKHVNVTVGFCPNAILQGTISGDTITITGGSSLTSGTFSCLSRDANGAMYQSVITGGMITYANNGLTVALTGSGTKNGMSCATTNRGRLVRAAASAADAPVPRISQVTGRHVHQTPQIDAMRSGDDWMISAADAAARTRRPRSQGFAISKPLCSFASCAP